MIYHYKLGLAQVEARLAEHRDRELKYCGKIRLLEIKDESSADCIESLKKELEFADDTVTDYSRPAPTIEGSPNDLQNKITSVTETGASYSTISSKPAIKFVKVVDRPAERPTTDKVETAKKPSVKYAELYRKTTKSYKVRGNQRNWNNLKSHQLGVNFVMKKKACYNYGGIDHLSYNCGKWVKMGRSCPKKNNTHKSMQPRPAIHRVDRFPTVDLKFSTAARRVKTAAPRPNMNSTQPQTT
nr:ubiquitin hydrolase [Tanacetum cinerariifolium]